MATIAAEKENLDTTLEIAPSAMNSLALGFDPGSGSQNSRVGISGNIWSADGLMCSVIQQHEEMPRPLRDTACDLIAQLISPLVDQLPPLPPGPPEGDGPEPALNDRGRLTVPAPADIEHSLQSDPTLGTLLGGAA
jgi:hypothetical protein